MHLQGAIEYWSLDVYLWIYDRYWLDIRRKFGFRFFFQIIIRFLLESRRVLVACFWFQHELRFHPSRAWTFPRPEICTISELNKHQKEKKEKVRYTKSHIHICWRILLTFAWQTQDSDSWYIYCTSRRSRVSCSVHPLSCCAFWAPASIRMKSAGVMRTG